MTDEETGAIPFGQVGALPLAPEDPRRIGAFPLLAVLGSGGMGRVYLGLAPTGYTAVKRVLPYLAADQGFLRHFSQELDNQARLPAGVSARLLAADRTARPPWFATEYIPGVTLHEAVHIEGGSLPVPSLWALLRELADRLRVVHGLSMMHRDLKPSNVMLTQTGVTLIDFGVARAADQSAVTATGAAVGTPAFMSPEQAKAERALTPAVDVFSLGGVICFAATGRPPFGDGSGHDVFYRIVHEEPDLSAVRAVDGALASLVEACLAKDPDERPSAAELLGFATANTLPGPLAWPRVTTERIGRRRAFAAAAPRAQFDGTELESSWIGAVPELPAPPELPEFPEAAMALPPVPVPVPEFAAHADPEVVTTPLPNGPGSADPLPDPGPISVPPPRRSHKTLILTLALLLVLGGTAGTLIAMNDAPFLRDDAGGSGPGTVVTSSPPVSSTSAAPTASATGSTPIPRASSAASRPVKPSPPAPSRSSSSGATTSKSGGSGSGGSGTGSSSGGGTHTTAPPSSGGGKTTPAPAGPSGPGSDPDLLSGTNVTVNDCEGWIDFGSNFFNSTVSAGASAGCEEAVTYSVGYGGETGSPSTSDISASNGKTDSDDSCDGWCAYFGDYTITARICVWNTDDSGDEACSPEYADNSGTVAKD